MSVEDRCVRLTFLGDIMLDWLMAGQINRYATENGDGYCFDEIFAPVKNLIKSSNYVMANLETPITEDHGQLTNQRWEFCSPISYAEAVRKVGVHWVATANNHCLDRGINGVSASISALDKIGLAHCGTYAPKQKRKPLIVDVDGVSIGLLSYTYGTNAISNRAYLPVKYHRAVDLIQEQEGRLAPWDPLSKYLEKHTSRTLRAVRDTIENKWLCLDNGNKQWYEKETWGGYRLGLLKKDIKWLRKHGADKILIYLHIGGQYNTEPNAYTKRMTQWLEDQGVDFVIANHEHVIHGSKVHRSGLTTYALGNFVSSAGTLEEPFDRRSEYSIAVHAYVDKITKELMKITYSVLKTVNTEEGKLQVWPVYDILNGQAGENVDEIRKAALLCAQDFSGVSPQEIDPENVLWSR